MADVRGEPTMEDILASIRRIIAEDPVPSSRQANSKKGGARPPMAENENVIASADVMNDDAPGGFEAHFQAATDSLSVPPMPEESQLKPDLADVAPVEDEEILELTELAGLPEDSGILSAATASVAAERLQLLSQMVVRPESGAMTLEGLVRDMLRPMLKEWLDANLPDIVDQVVSREIARLTGKGR